MGTAAAPLSARRVGGAGILAYSVDAEGKISFLMQQVLSGRKMGHLIDLGGALTARESPEEAACREFWEEGGRHLWPQRDVRRYFVATQTWNPHLRVVRAKRNWTLFLMRVPHVSLKPANNAARVVGSKHREYFWVSKRQFLDALEAAPLAEEEQARIMA